jgi:hypothetical protein
MALTLITCPNCGHSGFTDHLLPFPLRCYRCGHREMIQGGIDIVRPPEFDQPEPKRKRSHQRTTKPPAGHAAGAAVP